MRRKARIEDKLEKLSVADTLRAIRFAEVVVLVLDAAAPFEKQDLRIADLVEREGRALVIAVNKWDLMGQKSNLLALRDEADHALPQVGRADHRGVGPEGRGHRPADERDRRPYAVWNRRIPTA